MPALVAVTGPLVGARVEVGAELVVGRSTACQVQLPDDAKVSRRHARVVLRAGRCFLSDLASRNGTVVNGERLVPEQELPLSPGDRIQVGDTLFVFDPPTPLSVGESKDELRAAAVEQFLPTSGEAGAVLRAAMGLVHAASEAAVLRRGAEEALRVLHADVSAALLFGELGLTTAAVVGASEVSVPRPLLRASERREAARAGSGAVAPLWGGGSAFGLVYVERQGAGFDDRDLAVLSAIGRLTAEALAAVRARVPPPAEDVLVGTSRVFRRALDQVRRAGGTGHPVILVGAPGVGRSACVHYLHHRSPRALGPLVVVDCSGAPASVEEELWGRGPGPGLPARPSAFVRADGGTLALTSVDLLSHELAVRLAHELRERRSATRAEGGSDFRLVVTAREPVATLAATARIDLELAHELTGVEVGLPPLHERLTDIPLLFEHFALRVARRQGLRPVRLSAEAKDALLEHGWTGNVRELRLCAEQVALAYPGEEIRAGHLPRGVGGGGALAPAGPEPLEQAVSRLERDLVAQALRAANGKKVRAASILGISRPTLDKKIALYGLTVKPLAGAGPQRR